MVEGAGAAEGVEAGPHGEQVVADAGTGRVEVDAVATLDVGAHLGAEAEAEPPVGGVGQLPGDLRGHHRAAREPDGHAGQDVDVGGERGGAQERYAVRPASVTTRPAKPASAASRASAGRRAAAGHRS